MDTTLNNISKRLYAIPEVIAEIRDEAARKNLSNYEIIQKNPTPQDIKVIIDFATKTGDIASLSTTDIKVLALTYLLERETGDISHLRTSPLPPKATGQKKVPLQLLDTTSTTAVVPTEKDEDTQLVKETSRLSIVEDDFQTVPVASSKDNQVDETDDSFDYLQQKLKQSSSTSSTEYDPKELAAIKKSNIPGWYDGDSDEDNNDDDDEEVKMTENDENLKKSETSGTKDGWITPKNIQSVQKGDQSGQAKKKKNSHLRVACMTADFAMQNVLLQMNSKLVSTDGTRITKVKSWLLRCHACYKTTKKMESKFCPSCGNNTLIRTSYGIDQKGNTILYLKSNFQYNNRGTIYSIPTPKGGRKNTDIHLREDSREYQKALKNANHGRNKGSSSKAKGSLLSNNGKVKKGDKGMSLFDPDYVPLDTNRIFKPQPVVGYGRVNINAMNKKR